MRNRPPSPLDGLIACIYEGILTEESWVAALRLIAEITGSVQASLIAVDHRARHFAINENYNVAEAGVAEYNTYYHQYDPALDLIDKIPLGHWYYDRRHVGEQTMRHSEFYQDFMRRHGLASVIANPLVCNDGMACNLSLQRAIEQPWYRESDMHSLDLAIPHLQRAIHIREHLRRLETQAAVGTGVFDTVRLPLLVADETARLLLANKEAEAAIRRRPVIRLQHGRLRIDGMQPGMLERLLRDACGINGPTMAGGARIVDVQHQLALQVIVTPLPASARLVHAAPRPLALIMLHDPESPLPPQDSLLQQLYDLTPAEARIALLVLRGLPPSAIARQSGVAIATVRSQLKALFMKTGTGRQVELIRLLSPLLTIGQ